MITLDWQEQSKVTKLQGVTGMYRVVSLYRTMRLDRYPSLGNIFYTMTYQDHLRDSLQHIKNWHLKNSAQSLSPASTSSMVKVHSL